MIEHVGYAETRYVRIEHEDLLKLVGLSDCWSFREITYDGFNKGDTLTLKFSRSTGKDNFPHPTNKSDRDD